MAFDTKHFFSIVQACLPHMVSLVEKTAKTSFRKRLKLDGGRFRGWIHTEPGNHGKTRLGVHSFWSTGRQHYPICERPLGWWQGFKTKLSQKVVRVCRTCLVSYTLWYL